MGLTDEQREEVAALRTQRAETRRATVAAVEEILYEPLPVLDHGFVRVIDYMGDDAAIVQAAHNEVQDPASRRENLRRLFKELRALAPSSKTP